MSGSTQQVMISSSPAAAKVEVQTATGATLFTASTPTTVNLLRNGQYKVVIDLEGYQSQEIFFWREFNAWYLGNIIFGPLAPVGLIVDPISGALWNIGPRQVHVTLVVAHRDPGQEERVYVVLRATDHSGMLRSTMLPMTPTPQDPPNLSAR